MKFKTLSDILNHPLTKKQKVKTLLRYAKRALVIRLCPYPIAYPFIKETRLYVEKGLSSAELQIYTGLYEFEDMLFLLHFLRKEDTFIDIGANVGVYTVLASGVCGAESVAIEPIPSTYTHLRRNVLGNDLAHKVTTHNIGVGKANGILKFTSTLNASINKVATDEHIGHALIDVPVKPLDELLVDKSPSLIKIDVEGFENNVILGATRTLENKTLKAIIIELNGLSSNYGFQDKEVHERILSAGFKAYAYNPRTRKLTPIEGWGDRNTIYLRNVDEVQNRLNAADAVPIFNEKI